MKYADMNKEKYSRALLSVFSEAKSKQMEPNDSKFNINPFEKMTNPFKSRRRKLWNIGEAEKNKMNHFTILLYLSDKIKALISKFTNEYSSLTDQAEVNNLYNYFFDLSIHFIFFGYYAIFLIYKICQNFSSNYSSANYFYWLIDLNLFGSFSFKSSSGLKKTIGYFFPKYFSFLYPIAKGLVGLTESVVVLLFFPFLFFFARKTKNYSLVLIIILTSFISSIVLNMDTESWSSLWFPMSVNYVMFVMGFSIDHINNNFISFLPFAFWLILISKQFNFYNTPLYTPSAQDDRQNIIQLTLCFFRPDSIPAVKHDEFTLFFSRIIQSLFISICSYIFGYIASQAVFICIETACITSSETMVLSHKQMQLVSQLSHELRTPISAIIGWNELMMEDETIHSDHRTTMSHIHDASLHLLDLLNTILDVSKLGAKKMELRNSYFDLHNTIVNVAQFMIGLSTEKQLELLIDYPNDVPKNYIGDHGRIRQILLNLLSNAIKFTQRGGEVKVLVRNLGTTTSKSIIDISVEDTGCGIPIELHSLLFREFVQIGNHDSSQAKLGTGLGLYLVKSLVEMMGGRVWVKSMPNVGSTFGVRIPLMRQQHPDDIEVKSTSNMDKISRSSGNNRGSNQYNYNLKSLKDNSSINSSSYLMMKANSSNKISSQGSNINNSNSYVSNSVLEFSEEGSIERSMSFKTDKKQINPFTHTSTKKGSSEAVSNYLNPSPANNPYRTTIKKLCKMDNIIIGVSRRFNHFLQHVCQNNWHSKDVQILNLKQNKYQDLMLERGLTLDQSGADNGLLNISSPAKVISSKAKLPMFFIDLTNIELPLDWEKSDNYPNLLNHDGLDNFSPAAKSDSGDDVSTDAIYEVIKSISCWLMEAAEIIVKNSKKMLRTPQESRLNIPQLKLSSNVTIDSLDYLAPKDYVLRDELKEPEYRSYTSNRNKDSNNNNNNNNNQRSSGQPDYLSSRIQLNLNYNPESFIKSVFNENESSPKLPNNRIGSPEVDFLDVELPNSEFFIGNSRSATKFTPMLEPKIKPKTPDKPKLIKGIVIFFVGHEQINLNGVREMLESYFQVLLCRKPSSEPMILDMLKPIVADPEPVFKDDLDEEIRKSSELELAESKGGLILKESRSSGQKLLYAPKVGNSYEFKNNNLPHLFQGQDSQEFDPNYIVDQRLLHGKKKISDSFNKSKKFDPNALKSFTTRLNSSKSSEMNEMGSRGVLSKLSARKSPYGSKLNLVQGSPGDKYNLDGKFQRIYQSILTETSDFNLSSIVGLRKNRKPTQKSARNYSCSCSTKSEPNYYLSHSHANNSSLKMINNPKTAVRNISISRSQSLSGTLTRNQLGIGFKNQIPLLTTKSKHRQFKRPQVERTQSLDNLLDYDSNCSIPTKPNLSAQLSLLQNTNEEEKIVITNRKGFSWTFLPKVGFLPPSYKLSSNVSSSGSGDFTSDNDKLVNDQDFNQNFHNQGYRNNEQTIPLPNVNDDPEYLFNAYGGQFNFTHNHRGKHLHDLYQVSDNSRGMLDDYRPTERKYANSFLNEITESSGCVSEDKASAGYPSEGLSWAKSSSLKPDKSSFNIKKELRPHLVQTMNSYISKVQNFTSRELLSAPNSRARKIVKQTSSQQNIIASSSTGSSTGDNRPITDLKGPQDTLNRANTIQEKTTPTRSLASVAEKMNGNFSASLQPKLGKKAVDLAENEKQGFNDVSDLFKANTRSSNIHKILEKTKELTKLQSVEKDKLDVKIVVEPPKSQYPAQSNKKSILSEDFGVKLEAKNGTSRNAVNDEIKDKQSYGSNLVSQRTKDNSICTFTWGKKLRRNAQSAGPTSLELSTKDTFIKNVKVNSSATVPSKEYCKDLIDKPISPILEIDLENRTGLYKKLFASSCNEIAFVAEKSRLRSVRESEMASTPNSKENVTYSNAGKSSISSSKVLASNILKLQDESEKSDKPFTQADSSKLNTNKTLPMLNNDSLITQPSLKKEDVSNFSTQKASSSKTRFMSEPIQTRPGSSSTLQNNAQVCEDLKPDNILSMISSFLKDKSKHKTTIEDIPDKKATGKVHSVPLIQKSPSSTYIVNHSSDDKLSNIAFEIYKNTKGRANTIDDYDLQSNSTSLLNQSQNIKGENKTSTRGIETQNEDTEPARSQLLKNQPISAYYERKGKERHTNPLISNEAKNKKGKSEAENLIVSKSLGNNDNADIAADDKVKHSTDSSSKPSNALSLILARKNTKVNTGGSESYRNVISKHITSSTKNNIFSSEYRRSNSVIDPQRSETLEKTRSIIGDTNQNLKSIDNLHLSNDILNPPILKNPSGSQATKIPLDKQKLCNILSHIQKPVVNAENNSADILNENRKQSFKHRAAFNDCFLEEASSDVKLSTAMLHSNNNNYNSRMNNQNHDILDNFLTTSYNRATADSIKEPELVVKAASVDTRNTDDTIAKQSTVSSVAITGTGPERKTVKLRGSVKSLKDKNGRNNLQAVSSVKSAGTSNSGSFHEKYSSICKGDYGTIHKLPIKTPVLYNLNMNLRLSNPPESPRIINTQSNRQPRILVADDSSSNRMLLIRQLKTLGIKNVDSATDGVSACHQFQVGKYNLVFMDIQMPLVDGYQATKYIRAAEEKFRQSAALPGGSSGNTGAQFSMGDADNSLGEGLGSYSDNNLRNFDDSLFDPLKNQTHQFKNNTVTLNAENSTFSKQHELASSQYEQPKNTAHQTSVLETCRGDTSKTQVLGPNNPEHTRVIILALTADTSVRDNFEKNTFNSKLTGFDCVYCKPMDLRVLFLTIKQCLPWVVFPKSVIEKYGGKGD